MSDNFQTIRNQVMWDRLINVVEEQARTMMRVAFSPVVREAGDLSAGVFNPEGQLLGAGGHRHAGAHQFDGALGQALHGRVSAGQNAGRRRLRHERSLEGDRTPVRPDGGDADLPSRAAGGDLGLHAHVADIGGNGPDPTSRDVFAEGLFIPIMPLCMAGEVNHWLMKLMRANSREPDRLEGDVYALIASNEAGAERLTRMMDEYEMADISALSTYILETSDRSMHAAIEKLPRGTWTNTMRIDGFDEPLDLVTTL